MTRLDCPVVSVIWSAAVSANAAPTSIFWSLPTVSFSVPSILVVRSSATLCVSLPLIVVY